MEKILAIDDNKDNLISLRAIIKDAFPHSMIYTALNGQEGIGIALSVNPDVILLDILMPEMDGFEVCRCLKQNDSLRDIPVVFLTAMKQNKQSRIEALEVGADAFLSKPIDESELTAQIRAMVKIKESYNQIRHEKEHLSDLVAKRTYELEKSHAELMKLMGDLKTSEMRYRRLFESATDGIFIVDAETGLIIDVNQRLSDLLGIPCNQFFGENILDIGNRLNIPDTKTLFTRLLENGYTQFENLPFTAADGRQINVEMVCKLYFADKSRVIQCNVRDITERKQVEEKVKTLGKAIEQGPSSIVITNEKGYIEFVNNKFTSLTQYSLEEVRGRKPRIFNPGHMPEKEFDGFLETLSNGMAWNGEIQNRKKDKTFYWEAANISTLMNPDHSISNYILVMNDITEKKQMLNDLIIAKEKAEESDRLKSTFLANMSHEIRTPLNSIIGFSDLMLEVELDKDKQVEYARMINTSGINMLSIISDIMDISKMEAGQISLNKITFSVNQLLINVQDELSVKANKKGLELVLCPLNSLNEIYIDSDRDKVKQILVNIVGNAIKFSKEGLVKMGFEVKENQIEFYVKDSGIGISKDFQDKIFDRFCQVESDYMREYGGNGLGLAISKRLVDFLGGNIWLKSELGKGSVFYFTVSI
ncbi:MAG: PAS domain S-box protein [Bacteroidales bacterium]|nr:PAS domain S-box protein [Bacteroidales bacterium]